MAAKKKSTVTLYNPSNLPAVYSLTGHVIGGNERLTVDSLDEVGQRGVDHGYFINESAGEQSEPAPGAPDQESGS